MIVREIRDRPEVVPANFDYLRDWVDTRRWLIGLGQTRLVSRLDAGHMAWLRRRRDEFTAAQGVAPDRPPE